MKRFCDCHHPNCQICNICDAYEKRIAELERKLAEWGNAALERERLLVKVETELTKVFGPYHD